MVRFDLSSAAVVGMAVASSLSVGWWLSSAGEGGAAMAAPVAIERPAALGGAAQLVKAPDGHFWAEADIDGRAVRALVDTGASLMVLTREDALRLGLDLNSSDFNDTVTTASGPARAARVSLAAVSVAGAQVREVEAMVVEAGLPHSLLGMSYLSRLNGWQVSGDVLTLNP